MLILFKMPLVIIISTLTPHRYIKGVETSRMDFNHHFAGRADSGDGDFFCVPQNFISTILINDPGRHAALKS